jgi:hypothetical protein
VPLAKHTFWEQVPRARLLERQQEKARLRSMVGGFVRCSPRSRDSPRNGKYGPYAKYFLKRKDRHKRQKASRVAVQRKPECGHSAHVDRARSSWAPRRPTAVAGLPMDPRVGGDITPAYVVAETTEWSCLFLETVRIAFGQKICELIGQYGGGGEEPSSAPGRADLPRWLRG